MQLRIGTRMRSAVSETEVIVVKAPKSDVELSCGGYPMIATDSSEPPEGTAPKADLAAPTQLGKRYADEALGLELLVTKAGRGTLTANGVELGVSEAKKLPTSD